MCILVFIIIKVCINYTKSSFIIILLLIESINKYLWLKLDNISKITLNMKIIYDIKIIDNVLKLLVFWSYKFFLK